MKKILTCFACAALLLVGGCSYPTINKVDEAALDRLEAECKKINEVHSISFAIGGRLPNYDDRIAINSSMIADTKELSITVKTENFKQEMENTIEAYYKDNMMYSNLMGTKEKQKIDQSPFDAVGITADAMKDAVKFDREDLRERLSEASIKGDTIHMVIKNEVIQEKMKEQKSKVSSLDIDEVTQVAIDVDCREDLMQTVTMTLTGKADGASFSIYVIFSDFNQVKNIDYPKDIDSWPMAEE